MRARKATAIIFSSKKQTWHLRYWDGDARKSRQLGDIRDLPTREAAEKEAAPLIKVFTKPAPAAVPTLRMIAEQFTRDGMSERYSTRRAYLTWVQNYIVPRWGDTLITNLETKEIRLWIRGLCKPNGSPLSAKSKKHIKVLLGMLWGFAREAKLVPKEWASPTDFKLREADLGPVSEYEAVSLTEEQFHKVLSHLEDPAAWTIAQVSLCFGLRISECLGLQWGDVDWFKNQLTLRRAVVRGHLGALKTKGSRRTLAIDARVLAILKVWRGRSEFTADEDWIFASPAQLGRQPISYSQVRIWYGEAAEKAGVQHFGTHTMRHTYRSWMAEAGTALEVQQRAMRHADIRTTTGYGHAPQKELVEVQRRIADMAVPDETVPISFDANQSIENK